MPLSPTFTGETLAIGVGVLAGAAANALQSLPELGLFRRRKVLERRVEGLRPH